VLDASFGLLPGRFFIYPIVIQSTVVWVPCACMFVAASVTPKRCVV